MQDLFKKGFIADTRLFFLDTRFKLKTVMDKKVEKVIKLVNPAFHRFFMCGFLNVDIFSDHLLWSI